MKTGVTSCFGSFLRHITRDKRKFAFLQLVGRMEEFLVKEFIYHIYCDSKGSRFGLTNIGNKKEKKIDIAILSGNLESPTIVGFVEAKYLRNWHRAWPSDASDETSAALKSLADQLGPLKRRAYGNFEVKLASRSKDIYGLVFASYVSKNRDVEPKEAFFKGQLEKEAARKFRYHDLRKPYFRPIYDDVKTEVLAGARFCSLRAGLWKLARR